MNLSDGPLFYLGTHMPNWLALTDAPLFVSRRRLTDRKTLPVAEGRWALDSGGFTELSMFGEWRTTEDEYVNDVVRFEQEIGGLDWVAPMDWMCEPFITAKTGLTVAEHQRRTVDNYLRLSDRLPNVIPVLQGWTLDDYLYCWDLYQRAGEALTTEPVVGLGSVCRRQNTAEAGLIVRRLAAEGLKIHGFGVKLTGLESFGDALWSADSMAWSYRARNDSPLRDCTHSSCQNCIRYALRWRLNLIARLGQQRLEMPA